LDTAVPLIVAVGILCFVLRAYPRIGKPFIGHDAWAILLVVDELKKRQGYNGVTRYFLLGGDHDYPPLFFYFLSLFPSKWLRNYNWLINPLLDSLNAILVTVVGYLLTSNIWVAATAGAIYSFTPVVLEESLTLNTRIFGMILFNVTLVSYLLFQSSGDLLFLLLTIVMGILTLLSHKFASEVLALLLVSFAIIDRSFQPPLILLAIFLGAVISSGGFYLKVLRGQIGINKFWLKHYRDYGANYMKSKPEAKKASKPVDEREVTVRTRVTSLWNKTKNVNPLYWLLKLNPYNPFALVVVLLPFITAEGGWTWAFLPWSLLTLIFFYAATYLRFLGHYPGRTQFLDYNAFPTALLCSAFIWNAFAYWKLAVVGVAFLMAVVQIGRSWIRVTTVSRSNDQSLLEGFFDYIRKSPKDGVICIPASHTYAIPYFTGKKVFYTMSASNYEKLSAFFPVLTVPIEELSREYGINFLLIDKTVVPLNALGLSGFEAVMEKDDYVLLERTV